MKLKTGLIVFGVIIVLLLISGATDKGPEPRQDHGEDQLICPQQVEEAVGRDVTLDFHLKSQRDVTKEGFEWKFNESHRVRLYKGRGFSDEQAEQFRGRASLDSSGDLTEGKLPLKISSVQKTDAGRYSCSVGSGTKRISCSTELIIVDREGVAQDPSPTPKRDETGISTRSILGIAAGISVVAIFVGFAIWKCRRISTSAGQHRGRNRGNVV